MKDEMSAFDILTITEEMQNLIGGFVDKVFHWDGRNILLRVNTQTGGKKELMLQDMKWLYLAPERPEIPDFPSQFAVNLRKYLTNSRVSSVQQREFDRIVVIELEKSTKFQLIIELFGEGNLLLVSEGKILNCIYSKKWRHREVRPGVEYQFPPSRFNPRVMDFESFRKAVASSSSDVVRTLATAVNVGGQYAEETCLRADVDKGKKAKELDEGDLRKLFEALTALLHSAQNEPRPREVMENGIPTDVVPLPLLQHSTREVKEHPTLSDAIFVYLQTSGRREVAAAVDPETQRLERQLEQQRGAIDALMEESKQYSDKAALLYTDYLGIETLLHKVREGGEGKGWEEIKALASGSESIKSIDPAHHSLVIEMQGQEITLDYELGIDGNANAQYQQSKDAKDRMEGAKQALTETEVKLNRKRKEGAQKQLALKKEVKKTKEFWFERYKWFVTSGGRLVLAGRDAHSNDQLVKKHLKATDRFAHADVHGAPSVVMLNGAEASEEELREACVFALAHSKAWNAGASEGTAYWVLPDQVTKAPVAGEFVPRGAFVIRGKRNYIHHLPLELALGEVDYEGVRKIMCAPRECLEGRSERYFVIRPGKGERSRVSARLSRSFEVQEEEVSRILPPGDIDIVESYGISVEQ